MDASANTYPDGIDLVWIASDRLGQIAAFVTAGAGPISEQFLTQTLPNRENVEGQILLLPAISQVTLLTPMPRPDDFIALAQRGLYVFDWTDIHRTLSKSTGMYQLVASPKLALKIDDLSGRLRQLCEAVVFSDLDFSNCAHVGPAHYIPCISPSRAPS